MADNEPPDELSANASQPVPWPDPSRPIVNEQWGRDALEAERLRRRWPVLLAALVLLIAVLVAVWLVWWR